MSRRTIRRGMLRALLAGAAAAALALTGAVSAAAEEPATTTITGTVTREADGTPVPGVSVFVNSTNWMTPGGIAFTDANGQYSVTGIAAGEYVVRFAIEGTGTGLITEFWDGARDWYAAQRISTSGGEVVSGIDASLQQGGAITGRVTRESDGSPIAFASVYASDPSLMSYGMGNTDAEGVYRIEGLIPGDYIVKFDATDAYILDEYWESAYGEAGATRVAVAAGETDAGIDASLIEGATVSGQVTSAADGSPVSGSVELTSSLGSWIGGISPSGSYSVAVPAGEYTVKFTPFGYGLQAEYWDDALTLDAATTVSVTGGQSLSGIDAQIDDAVAITGTVTSEGEPLADAIVEAWQDGELVGMAFTDETGGYALFLPAGEYVVSAFGLAYAPVYARQYYAGAYSPEDSTPVVLGDDADRTGVDFDLELGGVIQGTVSAEEGSLPEGGAVVTAFRYDEGVWTPVAEMTTTGAYDFSAYDPEAQIAGPPLPEGTYTIGVEADGFCTRFLGGGATLDDAESVELSGGDVLTGLDVMLTIDCPEPSPAISLSSGSVKAGEDIEILGEHFAPGETVAFELHSDPIALGSLTADEDGRLEGSLRIPATVPPGAHTLIALGDESAIEASIALQVTASGGTGGGPGTGGGGGTGSGKAPSVSGGLASTGGDLPGVALLGGLLLATAGLVLVRRRRAAN